MKLFKLIILFLASNYIVSTAFAQANPTIAVAPSNGGIVFVGATIDITVTIGNTGTASIPISKLRPIITVPSSVKFSDISLQNPGLPTGWTILSLSPLSNPTQLRICNTSDVIPGGESRTIVLKIEGISVAPANTFSGQINFGNGTTCAAGAPLSGNATADDFATSTVQVVSPCGLIIDASAGTILCNGGTTTITASSAGVLGPIEYRIGNGAYQSSNIFTGLTAGTYIVGAVQVSNPFCTDTTTVTILEPAPVPVPVVSIVQPNCAVATGLVSITSPTAGLTFSIDGNTPYLPYTGSISLPTGAHTIRAKNTNDCLSAITNITINAQPITPPAPIVGTITQPDCTVSTGSVVLSNLPSGNWILNPGNITGNTTSTILNNLPAGIYNFIVTNDAGCSSISATTVNINTVFGAPTAPEVTIVQPSCTISTGSIIVTSPTAGLLFKLDNGTFVSYPSGGFTGVASGNHTLIVQNVSGCLSPFTNIIINAQPASPAAPVVSVLQPTCTVSTGTIIVTSDTLGLQFSLDNGIFNSYPTGGYTVSSGTHNLRVRNNSGCIPSITNNIIVNLQPASPSASISASTITCFGTTGTLTAVGSGGILPYEFSLNNVGGPFQTENIFSNVAAGTYFVVIKDANGCTGTTSNLTITQPLAIAASLSSGSIACKGGSTALTVIATGGIGTLEYSLNNTDIYQSSNIFNNVIAGIYTVKVRPVANPTCITTTSSITITQPDSLKATASASAISFCGGTTEVKVSAIGGKAPYTGTGSFVKGPGTWSFSVTDVNGCVATTKVTILPPGCVYVRVFPNPAQNNITVNHPASESASTIQIFGENGALAISKSVPQNAFITTIDISALASATYILIYINGKERKEIKFIKTNRK